MLSRLSHLIHQRCTLPKCTFAAVLVLFFFSSGADPAAILNLRPEAVPCVASTAEEQLGKEETAKEALASVEALGLSKIDAAELGNYVNVTPLNEESFYQLNFGAMIQRIALTTDNQLLIRTKDNMYHTMAIQPQYINALQLTGLLEEGIPNPSDNTEKQVSQPAGRRLLLFGASIFGIVAFISWVILMNRKANTASSFATSSKEKTPPPVTIPEKKVTFNEVQGIDELKPDLYRLVDALKSPEKYQRLGARPTKGLILYGPPGTGKTLIAKAISGEAGVQFFSASGSDFVEKYVGVGASRIRDLYGKAKKASPCIVFIDEVDAIGGNRGEANNSERDQTINALLTELDGFSAAEGILTICATNRLDMLDPALIRPGRFDLKIAVNLPDRKARQQILKLHSAGKRFAEDADISSLSKKTSGFSGAELENLLNESALIAAANNQDWITKDNLENAFFKIVMNGHKKARSSCDSFSALVAYHEAGHTLATKLLTKDGVQSVTIMQSTSGAGGVTFRTPEDVPLKSKKYLRSLIKVMYAGRAAEEIFLGSDDEITTGASQDIKQATEILKEYIGIYGMGNRGMIDLTQLTSQFDIIDEASRIATTLYRETVECLCSHREKLERLAQALLEKETLDESEIDVLISETKPTVFNQVYLHSQEEEIDVERGALIG